jgi:hypothetical protein
VVRSRVFRTRLPVNSLEPPLRYVVPPTCIHRHLLILHATQRMHLQLACIRFLLHCSLYSESTRELILCSADDPSAIICQRNPWLLFQRSFGAAGAARQKRQHAPINSDGHAAVCLVSRFTAWIWSGRHCYRMTNCLRLKYDTCWGTASCRSSKQASMWWTGEWSWSSLQNMHGAVGVAQC